MQYFHPKYIIFVACSPSHDILWSFWLSRHICVFESLGKKTGLKPPPPSPVSRTSVPRQCCSSLITETEPSFLVHLPHMMTDIFTFSN